MTQRSALLRPVLVLMLVLAASGCASIKNKFKDKDKNEGLPVSELYDRAHGYMEKGRWSNAGEVFGRLIAQYPYGPYTEQALMEQAYAEYKAGKHEDAISSIDRFIRTYPTHRNIAYLYYLRGLSNMARNTVFMARAFNLDTSTRDLAAPLQAYTDFNTVATRYPNSRYTGDARQRMVFLRNEFARFELNTGLYYLRRGAWVSAADRATYLLETYPQSQYQNDAVALLGEAYTRMGNTALAADARRVLEQNDPQHPWLAGHWPKDPSVFKRLNPFTGESR
ncbi:outer membrane protein assembly factor BamD [Thermomonas brevis]|jgi:outer membrane protein assembly factor BamD|uniref:Outer membrane protein assembly factor BamD n=1 Tax=Thermomonas brevis TaxID=215691 RepID=A0A7G9QWB1_9GAMM|nr:outer membrane protein assembly factor BamD [Thermomonas brevis]QNN47636.1 outer membrane protein assembly factor BamD [Thermomonas brevis]